MKLIIAGSRDLLKAKEISPSLIEVLIYTQFEIFPDEIVSGHGGVVDKSGEKFSRFIINKEPTLFPAEWDKYGNSAGPIRNKQMADYADALLLIWDGESKGSTNMKKLMIDLKKPVYEVILKKQIPEKEVSLEF